MGISPNLSSGFEAADAGVDGLGLGLGDSEVGLEGFDEEVTNPNEDEDEGEADEVDVVGEDEVDAGSENAPVGIPEPLPTVRVDSIVFSGALATLEGIGSDWVSEGTGEAKEPCMAVRLWTSYIVSMTVYSVDDAIVLREQQYKGKQRRRSRL
jgi:hypothetical protein